MPLSSSAWQCSALLSTRAGARLITPSVPLSKSASATSASSASIFESSSASVNTPLHESQRLQRVERHRVTDEHELPRVAALRTAEHERQRQAEQA